MQKLLEDAGFKVFFAFTQSELFHFCKQRHPNLIILGFEELAKPSNHQLCQQLKALLNDQGIFIPVMLLTSHNETEMRIEGFECGADDYMIKPPAKQELVARIRVLLRNQALQNELREAHKKLRREFKIIGEIQRSFLPSEFPSHSYIRLAACYEPSQLAGGDYYDVIEIDDEHWGLVMADIAGHGVSAAVVMALTQWTVKEFAGGITSPSEALTKFNEVLTRHLTSDHFVTMFYGVLNLKTMKLTYASAGHGAMIHYSSEHNMIKKLKTENGFPLKSFEGDQYDERSTIIGPKDVILLFTDGVVEVMDENHILYGIERLGSLLFNHNSKSPQEIVDLILNDTLKFQKDINRYDDFTLLVLKHI